MKRGFIALLCAACLWMSCSSAESFLWPVQGYYNISSGYGKRTSGTHKGIDINSYGGKTSISGTVVMAAKDGVAYAVYTACEHNYAKTTSCGCGGGYGNYVFLRHKDGGETRYAHLASVSVKTGQAVKRGETVGKVGSTGTSSGYHLHFEMRDSAANLQNPMPLNPDGRHTYVGSSAPQSQSVAYSYDEEAFSVWIEDGKICIGGAPEVERIYIAQFGKTHLLGLSVYTGTDILLLRDASVVRVFAWNGLEPVCAPVSLFI